MIEVKFDMIDLGGVVPLLISNHFVYNMHIEGDTQCSGIYFDPLLFPCSFVNCTESD